MSTLVILDPKSLNHTYLVLEDCFTDNIESLNYWVLGAEVPYLDSAIINWHEWVHSKYHFYTPATTPEELADLHPELFI